MPYYITQVVVTQTPSQGVPSLKVWGIRDVSLFTDSSDEKATQLLALQLKYLYSLNLTESSLPSCNSTQLYGLPITGITKTF